MSSPPASTDVDRPGLTVAATARRLGVSPTTLRTWDRRYGLGPAAHRAGTNRRYSAADIDLLVTMRRLVYGGLTPADAARIAKTSSHRPSAGEATSAGRAGGGRILALSRADAATRGLASAAMALDGEQVVVLLQRSLAEHGLSPTWQEVVVPVLDAVGQRWAATGEGVEVEHLLSDCLVAVLRGGLETPPGSGAPALLAGAEGELHGLPLYVLAAVLAERGIATRILGANTPARALRAAVDRSGPAVVFVWAQMDSYGDPSRLAGLARSRPAPAVVAGGPGWRQTPIERVSFTTELAEAVELIADRCGPTGP